MAERVATITQESSAETTAQPASSQGVKRRVSFGVEEDDAIRPKRLKEEDTHTEEDAVAASLQTVSNIPSIDGAAFADELAEELQCGCCSELVYRPVVVNPCTHMFCGSCVTLWIRNGGTNCPACRGLSTTVLPSRPLQAVVDILIRAMPSKQRTERERQQADAIYSPGTLMRIPPPREASPPPNLNPSDFARPCPHCQPGNVFGYVCPRPIVDPNTDVEHAWPLDDGAPPGHLHCGNCENLLAINAPTTTRCDFCQVSFCGINVPVRCVAAQLQAQHLHDMSDLTDFIQSTDVYVCFNNNTIEVDLMLDYLTSRSLTPRHIYRDIILHLQAQPTKFQPLFDQDLFSDLHQVSSGVDPDPSAERRRICRMCATEVMLWGLRDWWVRVRPVDPTRKDCPDGGVCERQKDLAHAKEFNHIIGTPPKPTVEAEVEAEPLPEQAVSSATLGEPEGSSVNGLPPAPQLIGESSADEGGVTVVIDDGMEVDPTPIPVQASEL